jgi:protein-S-isoprenylcysteine O-methyltransferase Ste14
MPGVYLYWFSIHPWVHFWRRVGLRRTMTVHYAMIALVGAAVFSVRGPLLAVEWGTNYLLIVLALPLFTLSVILRRQLSRKLTLAMLLGIPELDPNRRPVKLVTNGIYSRMRHPRYVEIVLALAGYTLVANYLAAYAILVATVVWVWLIVPIEEKELRERFGRQYEEYAERVPRFVPRWRG